MSDTIDPKSAQNTRAVFIISDGTGITAETLAHSVLTQFDLPFHRHRLPFIDNEEKAYDAVRQIDESQRLTGVRPIVFSTLAKTESAAIIKQSNGLHFDLIQTFVAPIEKELNVSSAQAIGRSHLSADSVAYTSRMEAINFSLAHDDGQSHKNLASADVILVGVSRSGKTPTSLYLAMQYGIKAANYPLIPEDFERGQLPSALNQHKGKLFGLSIDPSRLSQIRQERLPDSKYASLENCLQEVELAENMMKRENIRWLSSTTKSIEEIATAIMHELKLTRRIITP